MKRYQVFAGQLYYPCGGWEDRIGEADDLTEARALATKTDEDGIHVHNWAQIVDTHSATIVLSRWDDNFENTELEGPDDPTVNWSKVPEKWNAIACDADGSVFAYGETPVCNPSEGNDWYVESDSIPDRNVRLLLRDQQEEFEYNANGVVWHQSLIVRPEKEHDET